MSFIVRGLSEKAIHRKQSKRGLVERSLGGSEQCRTDDFCTYSDRSLHQDTTQLCSFIGFNSKPLYHELTELECELHELARWLEHREPVD